MANNTALVQRTSPNEQGQPVTLARSAVQQADRVLPDSALTPARSKAATTPSKPQAPSQTPSKQVTTPATRRTSDESSPNPATPGRWKHPRLDEVMQRQEKTRFDRDNVAVIMLNTTVLAASFVAPWTVEAFVWALPSLASLVTWPSWLFGLVLYTTLWLFRSLLVFNASMAIAPLLRTPDACEDIPLDPAQRKLLGLPPMSRPATPLEKEQWVTPPRFSRSSTPLSVTNSLRAQASGSPLASLSTPSGLKTQQPVSPFSPGALGSSYLQGADVRRRLSYTSARSSPLGLSDLDQGGSLNTPTKNGRASIALNNKWLYEKGWASSKGSPVL